MLERVERPDPTLRSGTSSASAVVTMMIVAAVIAWTVMSLGDFWPGGAQPAAANAYQYQYSGSVTGSGTIAGASGKVSFDVNARFDRSGPTGSCTVNDHVAKTKIKCLGVTSLGFAVLGGGVTLAVLRGPATIDGVATTYEIVARDGGTPGAGADAFSIETGSGFQRSDTLSSGNITIHGFP
jgi:hypothetical protein